MINTIYFRTMLPRLSLLFSVTLSTTLWLCFVKSVIRRFKGFSELQILRIHCLGTDIILNIFQKRHNRHGWSFVLSILSIFVHAHHCIFFIMCATT
uniref:Uncharacterized protein n=1 Tax=Ixodes ricinus TaxID=34613 RepID=A0A6B0UHU7_IXORI